VHLLFLSILLFLFIPAAQTSDADRTADDSSCTNSIICPGEELVYEVSWLKAHLGQVRLKILDSASVDGKTRHKAVAYIDSYEGLPFADVHVVNHTEMDTLCYSLGL